MEKSTDLSSVEYNLVNSFMGDKNKKIITLKNGNVVTLTKRSEFSERDGSDISSSSSRIITVSVKEPSGCTTIKDIEENDSILKMSDAKETLKYRLDSLREIFGDLIKEKIEKLSLE